MVSYLFTFSYLRSTDILDGELAQHYILLNNKVKISTGAAHSHSRTPATCTHTQHAHYAPHQYILCAKCGSPSLTRAHAPLHPTSNPILRGTHLRNISNNFAQSVDLQILVVDAQTSARARDFPHKTIHESRLSCTRRSHDGCHASL